MESLRRLGGGAYAVAETVTLPARGGYSDVTISSFAFSGTHHRCPYCAFAPIGRLVTFALDDARHGLSEHPVYIRPVPPGSTPNYQCASTLEAAHEPWIGDASRAAFDQGDEPKALH